MSFHSSSHPLRAAKAFTLFELLTVLLIVGVLAAIILSVCFSTRGKSHETVCLSNLRQFGVAIKMYESDYDDLPHKFKTLYPTYITDKQTFRCPQWEANLTTLPPDKEKEYSALFTMYSYEPEERAFWSSLPSEADDPPSLSWNWQKFYELRGERLPIVTCQFHDPTFNGPRETWGIGPDGKLQMTKLVLRLDGSVEKSTAHQKGLSVSWSDL